MNTKSNLLALFLILFLDLVGFSLIFPLFPELAKFYLEHDSESVMLQGLFTLLENFTTLMASGQNIQISSIVLFGGVVGSLYALMQFLSSPFWGNLSDKIGRRKVLLMTTLGMSLSYLVWGVAASFSLLILSRLFAGLMAGNISVATAAVSDMSSEENRSKSMAIIGIAFALGFIIGPAIGGVLSLVFSSPFRESISVGLSFHPFTYHALFSFGLSLLAFFVVFFKFKETNLNPEKSHRIFNPFKLLAPDKIKGLNLVNYSYFLFILGFSGMEFTLTFLALERFDFSVWDNAKMFVFIGIIITLIQGGYVRRAAPKKGEFRLSSQGFVCVTIGLLIVSFAGSVALFYLGLFFLAMGSAMIIPTLTSQASFFAPKEEQGVKLGVFRSLGSLGRVVGPIGGSVLYWLTGGKITYVLGSILIVISFLVMMPIKKLGAR